ncbi:MAG: ribonuclease T [Hyphomicrobium sp.]|jgi:ribonuclease T2
MVTKPRLTLPGALALIAVLSILAYAQGRDVWRGQGNAENDAATDRDSGSASIPASSRNAPGAFDYYALVLSWSPTHCSSPEGQDDAMQCARRDGRRYAFVLHGLWPQYERGYPESCPMRGGAWVAQNVIDGMLDIMPSPGLVKHEFRKHGTCSGLDATGYFGLARRLYDKISIPRRLSNPFESQFMSPDEIVDALVAANPALRPEMVAVGCGGPGSRLKDVHICFTKQGALRECGSNEDQDRMCRSRRVHIPPVRSTQRE